MNNGLEKSSVIKTSELDSEQYFQSLLEQAYNKGLLGDRDMQRIQYECLSLLAERTEIYSGNNSSSIRVERAQDIMASILFTLGLSLKSFLDPERAAEALQKESISNLFEQGHKRISSKLVAAKLLHGKLVSEMIQTPNLCYHDTIVGGIEGFFKLYDPDFGAHEIHITADYPTFNPIPKLAGIEFIQAYLNRLYYENLFLRYFSEKDRHHLLCGFVEDYPAQFMNLYEPVLLTALGCVMVGEDARRLSISEYGLGELLERFDGISPEQTEELVQDAAERLVSLLQCQNGLVQYIQSSLPLLRLKIQTASRVGTLERIFVLPADLENKPRILMMQGEKMDDETYRAVLKKIAACRDVTDKIAMIKRQVHSLADLDDVLLDASLTRPEMKKVLGELELPEIAFFAKRYALWKEPFGLGEREQVLREALQEFVAGLSQGQQERIRKASAIIEET